MELVNYIVGFLLVTFAIVAKFYPNIIPGYQSLSPKNKKNFSYNIFFWGLFTTAFIAPVAAFNIRFLGNSTFANWAFVIIIPVGLAFTFWALRKRVNRD